MTENINKQQIGFISVFGIYMLLGVHYFQTNLGGSGLELPANAIGWLLISVMIAMGIWQIASRLEIRFSLFSLLCISGAALMSLPLLWADPITVSISYSRLMGLWGGLLLLFSLQQMQFCSMQKRMLLYLILAAVLIESLFCLYQYFLLQPGNALGYDTQVNRPYGIFQQPNVAASFLTTGIALSFYLLVEETDNKKRIFCLLTAFVALLPIVFLQSRTGYLSLIVTLLIMLPWVILSSRKTPQTKWLTLWALLLGIAVLFGFLILNGLVSETTTSIARDHADMTNPGARIPIYLHSLNMLWQKPLFGWGYGSYEYHFLHTYTSALAQGVALPGVDENLNHPHNEMLLWAIEGGIVPVLGIIIITGGFLWALFKQYPIYKSLALIGLLTPLLIHALTEYPFYQSTTHWVIFLVLVWYMVDEYEPKNIRSKANFLLKFLAVLLPLLTIPYMLTTLHTTYLMVRYQQSDPRNLSYLTQVINPISYLSRFNYDVNMFKLRTAFSKQDKAGMEQYISWAKSISARTPRANVYIDWIKTLWNLGRRNEAKELMKQTKQLYPSNPKVQQLSQKMSQLVNPQ